MQTTIMARLGIKTVNLNRRQAIKERCLNCSAWNYAEVQKCTFTDCALYPYRTGKGKQPPTERNKAIRAYCLWCCSKQPSEVRQCPSGACALFMYRGSSTKKQSPQHPSFHENTPYRGQNKTSDAEGSMNLYPQEAPHND